MESGQKKFWSGWKDLRDFLRRYWTAYGGLKNLCKSPYLHLSVVFTVLSFGLWSHPDWWETFLMINPAILGFTIGGFALLLATGADQFGRILAEARLYDKSELESPMAKLGAAFVHFIIVQFISIIYAVVAKAAYKVPVLPPFSFLASNWVTYTFWGIGCLIAIYALVCAVATAEWIFRIVVVLVKFQKKRFRAERIKKASEDADAPPDDPAPATGEQPRPH